MPNFPNPFSGNVDRKMTNAELMQALRIDIAGELEAIFLYEAHYLATDDPAAKAVLADIRDEEKAHMGELITLMRHLDPTETEFFLEGEGEVQEQLAELGIVTDGEIAPAPEAPAAAPSAANSHRRMPKFGSISGPTRTRAYTDTTANRTSAITCRGRRSRAARA